MQTSHQDGRRDQPCSQRGWSGQGVTVSHLPPQCIPSPTIISPISLNYFFPPPVSRLPPPSLTAPTTFLPAPTPLSPSSTLVSQLSSRFSCPAPQRGYGSFMRWRGATTRCRCFCTGQYTSADMIKFCSCLLDQIFHLAKVLRQRCPVYT